MAKCSFCKTEGYHHTIDITGMHYDMTETTEPIYTSIHGKNFLCSDCMDKLEALSVSSERIRNFLYQEVEVVWDIESELFIRK